MRKICSLCSYLIVQSIKNRLTRAVNTLMMILFWDRLSLVPPIHIPCFNRCLSSSASCPMLGMTKLRLRLILQLTANSSWCHAPIWCPWSDFNFLCLIITSFLPHARCPLWREDGSVICSAITHWLESRRTHNHILLSHLRPPTFRARSPYLYPPATGWHSYSRGHWVTFFVASYDSQGHYGSILIVLHMRCD
jgi:hypothetical protein